MLCYKSDEPVVAPDASRIRQAKLDLERDQEVARATKKKFPRRITRAMIAERAGVSIDLVNHYKWLESQYPDIVAMNISLGEMDIEFFKTRTRERALGIYPPKKRGRSSSPASNTETPCPGKTNIGKQIIH